MTVGELIEKLSLFDKDDKIIASGDCGSYDNIDISVGYLECNLPKEGDIIITLPNGIKAVKRVFIECL